MTNGDSPERREVTHPPVHNGAKARGKYDHTTAERDCVRGSLR